MLNLAINIMYLNLTIKNELPNINELFPLSYIKNTSVTKWIIILFFKSQNSLIIFQTKCA